MLIAVELVDASADEVAKSRQICFLSFKQTIALALDLFPFYLEHPGEALICGKERFHAIIVLCKISKIQALLDIARSEQTSV